MARLLVATTSSAFGGFTRAHLGSGRSGRLCFGRKKTRMFACRSQAHAIIADYINKVLETRRFSKTHFASSTGGNTIIYSRDRPPASGQKWTVFVQIRSHHFLHANKRSTLINRVNSTALRASMSPTVTPKPTPCTVESRSTSLFFRRSYGLRHFCEELPLRS